MAPVNVIGTAAGVLTTFAFIPQILKIRKQGADDLSYAMLAVYFVGVALWLVYGLILHAAAIIWTNAITDLLVGRRCHHPKSHVRRPRSREFRPARCR
jgi:MtN3 and saliva related transmembrane protein